MAIPYPTNPNVAPGVLSKEGAEFIRSRTPPVPEVTPPPPAAAAVESAAVKAAAAPAAQTGRLAGAWNTARNATVGAAKAAPGAIVRGNMAFSPIVGGMRAFDDETSGYADKTFGDDTFGHALNAAANVGDAATFGLAGRIGRGLNEAAQLSTDKNSTLGQQFRAFKDAFIAPSPQDQFAAQQSTTNQGGTMPSAPSAMPSAPSTQSVAPSAQRLGPSASPTADLGDYKSLWLKDRGVPTEIQNAQPLIASDLSNAQMVLKNQGTPTYQNLGGFGGKNNIYGRSSDGTGRINDFVGIGDPAPAGQAPARSPYYAALEMLQRNRPAEPTGPSVVVMGSGNDTNSRYDQLARQLSGKYGANGQGNLAKQLVALEAQRSNALAAERGNDVSLRNANLSAETSRYNTDQHVQSQLLNNIMQNEAANKRANLSAMMDMHRLNMENAKYANEREETGYKRLDDAINKFYPTMDKDGKPGYDAAKQQMLRQFIEQNDPEYTKKTGQATTYKQQLMAMDPQAQMAALQDWARKADMQAARNAAGRSVFANAQQGASQTYTPAQEVGDAEMKDIVNGLPVVDYGKAKLRGIFSQDGGRVIRDANGLPRLYKESVLDANGNIDRDKVGIIDQDLKAAKRLKNFTQ